jgi:hypothetical protein
MYDIVLKRDLDGDLYFEPRSSKGDDYLSGMFEGYADRDVPKATMIDMALHAERHGLRVGYFH